jgi:hypothetical protein
LECYNNNKEVHTVWINKYCLYVYLFI